MPRLQFPEGLLRGHFIQSLGLTQLLFTAVLLELSLAEFLQHADFAIGLDQRLTAALDLGRHRLALLGDALPLRPRNEFVALGLDQPVDVDDPG